MIIWLIISPVKCIFEVLNHMWVGVSGWRGKSHIFPTRFLRFYLVAKNVTGRYEDEKEMGISYTDIIVTNDVLLRHITSDVSSES